VGFLTYFPLNSGRSSQIAGVDRPGGVKGNASAAKISLFFGRPLRDIWQKFY
jgi:hypothetical protein